MRETLLLFPPTAVERKLNMMVRGDCRGLPSLIEGDDEERDVNSDSSANSVVEGGRMEHTAVRPGIEDEEDCVS